MAKIKIYQEVKKHHTVELLAEINTTLEGRVHLDDLINSFKFARYLLDGHIFAVIEKDKYYTKPTIKGYRTIDDYHSCSELNLYKVVNSWV